ncbi:aminoglycoside phosphotransferase (APT) family kinase protein [Asanoa ferruginea]|uniref:Aminoglycoside phosphotransferase (APT) family kinase protein n=1 Tax=Asanoa ferruginea TaxID=53367 RepID=A0A3D9ZF24_9ACTN|nr:aminoglycoside phosphotransferase family protein [Asanoa ferruginea]REF96016.1 aminoglycoside phosphotransferase (APT) family kinase protein [Asanoa ferruginea]GIF48123.1 aminoglycoside phosphotransferase [Asanoa ferruginea]
MTAPVAEIDVNLDLVARLLRAQQPDLADRPLRLVANGWDNTIVRLGDDLCVRLPRRQVAVQLLVNEQRWLPTIATHLPLSVPTPVRLGVPGEGYPWPWSVCRWFEGEIASMVPVVERRAVAAELAEFMNRLHVPAPDDAPANPVRGVPLVVRDEQIQDRLTSGKLDREDELRDLWDELRAAPEWTGPKVWLHGDPHPANLVLRGQPATLAAVLDFGDLTAGDPATDLAAAWLVFDAEGRAAFRAGIEADEATWRRARAWALAIGTAIAVFADIHPGLADAGEHAINQVLSAD